MEVFRAFFCKMSNANELLYLSVLAPWAVFFVPCAARVLTAVRIARATVVIVRDAMVERVWRL